MCSPSPLSSPFSNCLMMLYLYSFAGRAYSPNMPNISSKLGNPFQKTMEANNRISRSQVQTRTECYFRGFAYLEGALKTMHHTLWRSPSPSPSPSPSIQFPHCLTNLRKAPAIRCMRDLGPALTTPSNVKDSGY